MHENISDTRLATLENEVKHITNDVADIKKNSKSTNEAIQSIDVSIAVMAENVKQNQQLVPRIEHLESKLSTVEIKIAAYAGSIAAISIIIFKLDKIKSFFV